ncbi:hypothetical protein J6590_022629 [Homalodisca vitripennis]|nr:hypothetical protein J6590_022629 [Homalodisca vitripennis]
MISLYNRIAIVVEGLMFAMGGGRGSRHEPAADHYTPPPTSPAPPRAGKSAIRCDTTNGSP